MKKLSWCFLLILVFSCSDKSVNEIKQIAHLELSLLAKNWTSLSCIPFNDDSSLQATLDLSAIETTGDISIVFTEHADTTCSSPEQIVRYTGNANFDTQAYIYPYENSDARHAGFLAAITVERITYEPLTTLAAQNASNFGGVYNVQPVECFPSVPAINVEHVVSACHIYGIGFAETDNVLEALFLINDGRDNLHTSAILPFTGDVAEDDVHNTGFSVTPTSAIYNPYIVF